MQATVELPEDVLRQLEILAEQEGATTGDLIRRLLEAHVASQAPPVDNGHNVRLPLVPASETGPIQPISGKQLDDIITRDDFAA